MADEAVDNAPAAESASLLGGEPAAEPQPGTEGEGQPVDAQEPAPQEGEGEEGGKAPKDGDDDGKGEDGPPEKYEFTAPEGYEGELDQDALSELEPVARELGLTNEQANKLVAVQAKHLQAQQARQQEQLTSTMEGWVNDLKNDAEFGGANFDKNAKVAQKALEAFGSPELKQLLNESGLGSHPELVKAFHKIGLKISEDTMERGTGGVGARPIEERLYGNTTY